jgi:hypothetical protein
MAKSKKYNTKSVGTIWLNENKETKEMFTTVQLVSQFDDKGKPNKYCKVILFGQDLETGKLYNIKKFKTFENDKHDNIIADIAIELNDEEFAVEVVD